jgi:hypothetical protein
MGLLKKTPLSSAFRKMLCSICKKLRYVKQIKTIIDFGEDTEREWSKEELGRYRLVDTLEVQNCAQ